MQCLADGLPPFEQEYVFCATRKFRLDIAFPAQKVGLEICGGVWKGHAHSSPLMIERDMEKANLLVVMGWKVLRYQPKSVMNGEAIEGLKSLLVRTIK